MIAVNTTFYVESSVETEFLRWVRNDYLPSATSLEGFGSPCLARLMLEPQDGMNGYAVQVCARDAETAASWHDSEGARLRGELSARFGQKVLFFTTYMEQLPL